MMAVAFRSTDLWRHVERCADVGGCKVMAGDDLGKAKITEFDGVVLGKENCVAISLVSVLTGAKLCLPFSGFRSRCKMT